MANDKAPKKPKQPKKGKATVSATAMSISGHPRATYSIQRARGFGGMIGLVLVGLLSYRAGALPVVRAPSPKSAAP